MEIEDYLNNLQEQIKARKAKARFDEQMSEMNNAPIISELSTLLAKIKEMDYSDRMAVKKAVADDLWYLMH